MSAFDALMSRSKRQRDQTPLQREEGREKKRYEQAVLDFGQSGLRHSVCPLCRMTYYKGNPEDEGQHRTYHRTIVNPILYSGQDTVASSRLDGSRIVRIRNDAYKKRWRFLARVLQKVNFDLGGCREECESHIHLAAEQVYLYINPKRHVVGCLLVEPLVINRRDMLGIDKIWVHADHRRHGVATQLIDTARSRFRPGMMFSKQECYFSDPTQQGRQFASAYTHKSAIHSYSARRTEE